MRIIASPTVDVRVTVGEEAALTGRARSKKEGNTNIKDTSSHFERKVFRFDENTGNLGSRLGRQSKC